MEKETEKSLREVSARLNKMMVEMEQGAGQASFAGAMVVRNAAVKSIQAKSNGRKVMRESSRGTGQDVIAV